MERHSESSRRMQLSLGNGQHPLCLSLGIKDNTLQVGLNIDNEKKAGNRQKWNPHTGRFCRPGRTINHCNNRFNANDSPNQVVFDVPQDKVTFSINDTPFNIGPSFRKGSQTTFLQEATNRENKNATIHSQWRESANESRLGRSSQGEKTITNDDTAAIAKNFADLKREMEEMNNSIAELKDITSNRESTRIRNESWESSKEFIQLEKQLERVQSIENLLVGIVDPSQKPSKHISKVKAIESKLEDLKKPLEDSLLVEKVRLSRIDRRKCTSVEKLVRKLTKSLYESKLLIDSVYHQDRNLASMSKDYIKHVQVLCDNQQTLLRKLSKIVKNGNEQAISDDVLDYENRIKSNDRNSRVQSKSGSSHNGMIFDETESNDQLQECKPINRFSDKSLVLKKLISETKSDLSKLEEKLGGVKSSYESIESQWGNNRYKGLRSLEGNSHRNQEVVADDVIAYENRIKSNDRNSKVQSKSIDLQKGMIFDETESNYPSIDCKPRNGISDKSLVLKKLISETKSELSKLEEKVGGFKSSHESIESQRRKNSYERLRDMESNSHRNQEASRNGSIFPLLRTITPGKESREDLLTDKLPCDSQVEHASGSKNGSTNDYICETVIKQTLRRHPTMLKFKHSKSDVSSSISQIMKQVDKTVEDIQPFKDTAKSSHIKHLDGTDGLSKNSTVERRLAAKIQGKSVTEGESNEGEDFEVEPDGKFFKGKLSESNEILAKNLHESDLNKNGMNHRDISGTSNAGNEIKNIPLVSKGRISEVTKFSDCKSKSNEMLKQTSLSDKKGAEFERPKPTVNAKSMRGHDSLNLRNNSLETFAEVNAACDCSEMCNNPDHSDFIDCEPSGIGKSPTTQNEVIALKKNGDLVKEASKKAAASDNSGIRTNSDHPERGEKEPTEIHNDGMIRRIHTSRRNGRGTSTQKDRKEIDNAKRKISLTDLSYLDLENMQPKAESSRIDIRYPDLIDDSKDLNLENMKPEAESSRVDVRDPGSIDDRKDFDLGNPQPKPESSRIDVRDPDSIDDSKSKAK